MPPVALVLSLLGLSEYAPTVDSTIKVAGDILPALKTLQGMLATEQGKQLRDQLAHVLKHTAETPSGVVIGKTPAHEQYAAGEYKWDPLKGWVWAPAN